MWTLQQEPISEEEKISLIQFVTDLLMIDYKTFEENKSEFPWYWSKIMRFFMLPHTELHEEYMKRCRPCSEVKEKKETDDVLRQMSIAKWRFVEDNNVDESDVKYFIVKRFTTLHNLWDRDERITIWIPYYAQQQNKYKFGWTVNICKSKTPKLFDDITKNFRRFNKDEEIYLSLDK